MIDAFKRASAGRITAVMPYYAYGRSDKKDQPRVPITARLIADMITVAGADRVLTMDLHQGQIQGFFNIPVDELTAVHMLSQLLPPQAPREPGRRHRPRLRQAGAHLRRDPGGAAGDRREATRRQRRPSRADERHRRGPGKRAIIVDDEIDTAGTLVEITRALEREGVTEIYACATHGVLSDPGRRPDRRLEPSRGRPDRHDPAAGAETTRQDHDAVGRAAHRRGDQAHPSRRIGRRPVLDRGLADAGDASVGGWLRGHAGHARRRRGDRDRMVSRRRHPHRQGTDDPPAPQARRRRRPRRPSPTPSRTGATSCSPAAGARACAAAGCRSSATRR